MSKPARAQSKRSSTQRSASTAGSEGKKPQTPNTTTEAPRSVATSRWLWETLLVVGTLLAYLPALQGKFVWDDDSWTLKIAGLLRDFSGLVSMWTRLTALQQYFPLTGSSFWLDYHLWGFWTMPYHVENVLLHVLAALLFWRVLERLRVPGGWLAAAIFALHPVMVESAGWITERKNVLSLCFYLGALLAFGRWRGVESGWWMVDSNRALREKGRTPSPWPSPPGDPGEGKAWLWGSWGSYAWALVLFAAALLAKTTAFSLPPVLLLICWWKRGRIRWREDVLPTLPFFALAFGFGFLVSWVERHHVGSSGPEWAISFPERCLIAGRALWFYVGKLVWPANLCFVYPRWQLDTRSVAQWLYPISAAGTIVALWLARARIGRGAVMAALFFVGTLLPLLGFINGYFMRYSFVCDHWAYLSNLALIALVVGLLARAAARLRAPGLLYGFAAVVLPVLGLLTWRQSGMYRNMETLWQTTLARNPAAGMAHSNLGSFLLEQGRVDEAAEHFQRALELQPGSADAHSNFGSALLHQGRVNEAVAHFQKALKLQPDAVQAHNNLGNALLKLGRVDEALAHFQKAVEMAPDLESPHYNLGTALLDAGRVKEAIVHLRRALEIRPEVAEIHNNLGNALLQDEQLDEALAQLRKAVEIQPGLASAQHNLGNALFKQGQVDEAMVHFHAALEAQPNLASAHNSLANALVRKGQVDEAVVHFEHALKLRPNFAEAHHNLADVLVQQGRADEAIPHFRKALELEPNLAGAHNNLGNALLGKGQVDEAIEQFNQAIKIQPNLCEAHNNLGNAFLRKGKPAEAVGEYRVAAAAQPENPYLLNNLAWVLATYPEGSLRNGEQAVEFALQAERLSGGKVPFIVGTLAAAYAEAGRFPEAVATGRRALELVRAQGDPKQIEASRARLELYEAGKAFRDEDLRAKGN